MQFIIAFIAFSGFATLQQWRVAHGVSWENNIFYNSYFTLCNYATLKNYNSITIATLCYATMQHWKVANWVMKKEQITVTTLGNATMQEWRVARGVICESNGLP